MKNLSLILFSLLCFTMFLFAGQPRTTKAGLHQTEPPSVLLKPTGLPATTMININGIAGWIRNDGWSARDPLTGNAGGYFPRGTATAIFQDGIVWGGHVNDGGAQVLRVGGQTYNIGTVGGRIISKGVAADPNDADVRIYRIRRDYKTADLKQDASEILGKGLIGVTEGDIAVIRAQYEKDWNEWPTSQGAPYYDRNSNGVYDPGVDEPGLAEADQVIWFVCNDLNAALTNALYGSAPIGMELQVTLWGYNRADPLAAVYFKKFTFIYKGTASTQVGSTITDMYVAQWSDPDMGDAGDDFAGCDTALSLEYVYNGRPIDVSYANYSLKPPAVGYDFLQGPMVNGAPSDSAVFGLRTRHGKKNLPMTAAFYFAINGAYTDPPFDTSGTWQWYNLLRGLTPAAGTPFIHPAFPGQPTKFWLDGDPVKGTGRIDGVVDAPGDRRIGLCSGPFSMALGDTQEVVVGVIGGIGRDYLNSISVMKQFDHTLQFVYDNLFTVIPPSFSSSVSYPSSATATISLKASSGIGVTTLVASFYRSDGNKVTDLTLFDDGAHDDGAVHDGVFANSLTLAREQSPFIVQTLVNGIIPMPNLEPIPTVGPIDITNPVIFSDNLNSDLAVNPGENVRYGFTITNLTPVKLVGIVGLSDQYNLSRLAIPELPSGSQFTLAYNGSVPTTYFDFNVPTAYQDSFYRVTIAVADTLFNLWKTTLAFPVKKLNNPIYGSPVTHTGLSDWSLKATVVDKPAVKNNTYEVSIVDSIDVLKTKGFNIKNLTTGATILSKHAMPDELGHNIPVTDGFKVLRGGSYGKPGMSKDSTRWIAPLPAWMEGGLRFSASASAAFNGGVTMGFDLPPYLGAVSSSFDSSKSVPVEIRFDQTKPQKAYRMQRAGGVGLAYVIQQINPFVNVPFSAWDVSGASPRQLTVAWRDQDNSFSYSPLVGNDGIEVIFVYSRSYNSAGGQWPYQDSTAVDKNPFSNVATVGPQADIMYGVSLQVVAGHTLSESPGTLFIRPIYPISSNDKYQFNPTNVLFVADDIVPSAFALEQNYPNPFNPATTIQFELSRRQSTKLRVYDLLGREVQTLMNEPLNAGKYSVKFDGSRFASGVYFYRIEAGAFVQTKKMLLLK